MNCFTFDFKNKVIQKEYSDSNQAVTKKIYIMQNLILFIMMSINTLRITLSNNNNTIDKKQIVITYII